MSDNSPQIRILDKYPGPIGVSTNPTNPNQLFEVESKIREGFTAIEAGTISFSRGHGGSWADVPKQIWEEVARLARLNNIKLSLHAPIQDLQIAGFADRYYAEPFRKESASKLAYVLQTAGEMANLYGDTIKVNVHAGEITSAEWDKEWEEKIKRYLQQDRNAFESIKQKLVKLGVITSDQAKQIKTPDQLPSWVFAKSLNTALPVETDPKYAKLPSGEYMELHTIYAKEEYDPITNQTKLKTVVDSLYEESQELLKTQLTSLFKQLYEAEYTLSTFLSKEAQRMTSYKPQEIGILYTTFSQFDIYASQIEKTLHSLYNYFRKNNILSESEIQQLQNKLYEARKYRSIIEGVKNKLEDLQKKLASGNIQGKESLVYTIGKQLLDVFPKIEYYRSLINEAAKVVMCKEVPILQPVPELAPKLSKKTIQEAYEKTIKYLEQHHPDWLKDPEKLTKVLPMLTIENSYAGLVGTRPDEMIKFVENSKEALKEVINRNPEIKKAIEKKYKNVDNFINERIGACVDIAHLKGFIKSGYTKEDILNWLKQLKPYIKHIHSAEAMYGEDTHLIPGMDWSDITKAELEELKDVLSKEGVYMIQEIGGWYGNFYKTYRKGLPYVLEMMGYTPGGESSYYSAIFRPEYFSGWPTMYSTIYSPQIQVTSYSPFAHQTFSMLPPHLGGKVAQTFSGQQT